MGHRSENRRRGCGYGGVKWWQGDGRTVEPRRQHGRRGALIPEVRSDRRAGAITTKECPHGSDLRSVSAFRNRGGADQRCLRCDAKRCKRSDDERRVREEVRRAFVADLDSMQAQVVALANALPADKYSCRPAPGVRSVGDVFQHIASEYYLYTPMAYGLPPSTVIPSGPDAMAQFEKASTQADVLKHRAERFTFMRALVLGADVTALTGKRKLFGKERTIAETSLIMSGDLHEHLGQLIAYSRMNGIKPPWSK